MERIAFCKCFLKKVIEVRHPLKQLALKWIDSSEPRLSSGISTPNLVVQSAVGHYCEHDSAYSLTGFNAPHAQFGCVRAKLIMSRPLYIPLIRFFLPSILAIFISWSSIYINRNQIQTRLTVLIFSTSIICFIIFNAYSDMPTLVYLTAADIWLIICSIFLSISFVEFLIVQMLTHLSQKYRMLADKDTLVRKESRYRHEKRALRNAFVNMNASPKVPVANGRIFDKKHEVVRLFRLNILHFEIQPSSSSISNSDVIIYQHFRRWADYLSIMAARVDLGARIILPILFSLLTFLYFLFWIIL
ncbi:unnamed protein product [Anisakis simplex]|uniref:Neur_chan_memb domain-containing protein n=1 Tax=Anisakis simplex TaxID=6269 RepID=A0A0M3J6K3_ANISI|nr:unnamed protein product [Anisakis simplex]